ncbi:hypothetical protein MalM25_32780 [Planctomycetes bacterium MalM25]|nr:hypothetical protein MalM25_32780 [Planctomycetes bacterium MalM25]
MMPRCHGLLALLIAGAATSVSAETFLPSIAGRLVDLAPQGDGADQLIANSGLVANVNGAQHRPIKEFDLSSIAGRTVLNASVSGQIVPNNSSDTGQRDHQIRAYQGDGFLGTNDYDAPSDLLGSVSHPSGGSSGFDFDATGYIDELLSDSNDYFGLRVNPVNEPQGFDVLVNAELTVDLLPEGLEVRKLNPTVDAQAFVGSGISGVNSGGNSLLAYDRTTGNDDRVIMEYNLASIPSTAQVSHAWLDIDIFSFTFSQFDRPELRVYGYEGDGAATPDDATQTDTLLAASDPVQRGGAFRVFLDAPAVESILSGGASHFGLLGVGDPDHNQLSWWASEASSFASPPSLTIAYSEATPQNADYTGDGRVDAADYTVWRDSLGSTSNLAADGDNSGEVDQADYDLWAAHYGQESSGPEIANADFETGELSDWEEVVTPNGTQLFGFPRVESFDVDGDGESSLAYRTAVGQQSIDFNNPAGAGIRQEVDFGAGGDFNLSVDVAAASQAGGFNSGPGRFELLVGGVLVDVVDFNESPGSISPGEVLRDQLTADLIGLAPGVHDIEVLILRPFVAGSAIYQYLDDFVLTPLGGVAVPEPTTALLAAFAAAACCGRRRPAGL